MQLASQAFQKGDTSAAILLYSQIIQNKQPNWQDALLNRSSAYYSQAQYSLSLKDAHQYIQNIQKPLIHGYIVFTNSLIKQKTILTPEQRAILDKGRAQFPEHKKYLETIKIIEELQITEDQDEFLDRIFEKLLSEPKIRNCMQQESFLTKVQKMIKNPALASALIKMDSRLADVQEIILMAEE